MLEHKNPPTRHNLSKGLIQLFKEILLTILLLIPTLSWGDTHPEKDTSLFCLLEPHVQIGDYPLVNRHAWWLKIYGGENYIVDAFRIKMTDKGPELNKFDGNYTVDDLNINFDLPDLTERNYFYIDRASLELKTFGYIYNSHFCEIIDDAFTEAKGAHARLLAQYLEDQAKLKSE